MVFEGTCWCLSSCWKDKKNIQQQSFEESKSHQEKTVVWHDVFGLK